MISDRRADEVFREIAREKRREARRKERIKAKREGFRLRVGEWEAVKAGFNLRDEHLESDDDDEEEGLWLKRTLRKGIGNQEVEGEWDDVEEPVITSKPTTDFEDSLLRATSSFQSLRKRSHNSATAGTWKRDKARRLRRVGSIANLRAMNKRYDPEAESIYSRSTGTLLGGASRSLIALADANYEMKLERKPNPDILEINGHEYQGGRTCLGADHLWFRRKTLSMLLHDPRTVAQCWECNGRFPQRKIWTCLIEACRTQACDDCKMECEEKGGKSRRQSGKRDRQHYFVMR
ncbi:MAG: hypothetical protein Q9224_002584 [Gallowayella concinna]